jgi:O-acetyl-ADP-ribose deacetylase (regulator of RNase III)
MISLHDTDLFASRTEALVNPVNCVGVAGAGLAKEFKQKFPKSFLRYHNACADNTVRIGSVFVDVEPNAHYVQIIYFPTKSHCPR